LQLNSGNRPYGGFLFGEGFIYEHLNVVNVWGKGVK
jgi:hypothetical protein